MKLPIFILSLYLLIISNLLQANEQSRFVLLDTTAMAKVKKIIESKKLGPRTKKAYGKLITDANQTLVDPAESVTVKTVMPPSGDKHDYLSISRYWWPDPSSSNGLPWIDHDGKTNPISQTDQVDRQRLSRFIEKVRHLSLAYYFTDNDAYAQKAVMLIDTWFFNPDTLMNPHLKYAQMVPGKKKNRPTGILDGRQLATHLLDSVNLISMSPAWTQKNQTALDEWMKNYLLWLTESYSGRTIAKKLNYHVSWYRLHVASIAWYLGDFNLVKEQLNAIKRNIYAQMDKSGKQSIALKRKTSFYYSYMNLEALTLSAMLAKKVGIDLWRYKAPNGASIISGIDYMATYSSGKTKWPHPEKSPDISLMPLIFLRAENEFKNGKYKRLLATNPYKTTSYGAKSAYKKVQEQERYLLNFYDHK